MVGWVFVETGPAGLVEMKSVGFLDDYESYGEMAWLWGICRGYGRMAGLWGSAKTYGEMRQACGRMGEPRYHMGRWPVWGAVESHGRAAKTYGKCHGIWEPAPAHGEAARLYGEP